MKEKLIALLTAKDQPKPLSTEEAKKVAEYLVDNNVVVLPAKIGDIVFEANCDCDFGQDCYTKRLCADCEYNVRRVDTRTLHPSMLTEKFELPYGVFLTAEEAESFLEANLI